MKRLKPVFRFIPFVAIAGLLGTVGVKATYHDETRKETVQVVAEGEASKTDGKQTTKTVKVGDQYVSVTVPVAKPGQECAPGRNGGSTDVGVSGSKIKLAYTMVQSGPGASFLGLSKIGIQAVIQKVNRAGGICGRILDPKPVDDGWKADDGQKAIKSFIREGYFALPVVPSSEGLTQAIRAGDIDGAGIPVVGTDGMLIEQYKSDWVWPVATATVSTMRIMARYGYYTKGTRSFAIVYDKFYKFGKEGKDAFEAYVRSLPGAKIKAAVGIQPGQASYASEIQTFNEACATDCEFVAMLLEPSTAETWIAGQPVKGSKVTSGAQTLFNDRFAKNCAGECKGMLVWTGYNPPIGSFLSLPGVRAYVNDVKTISPTADATNQFMEGAYLGMSVFVEALKAVGPNLTRKALKSVLDQIAFQTDLASGLRWTSSFRHANKSAQAFEMTVSQGSFSGFRFVNGFITDPSL